MERNCFVNNIFLDSMFSFPLTLVMKLNFNCMKFYTVLNSSSHINLLNSSIES